MTNDKIEEISCDQIIFGNGLMYDRIVYFGTKKNLRRRSKAELFRTMAIYDRFVHNEQRAGFYINTDAQCRDDLTSDLPVKHKNKETVYYFSSI